MHAFHDSVRAAMVLYEPWHALFHGLGAPAALHDAVGTVAAIAAASVAQFLLIVLNPTRQEGGRGDAQEQGGAVPHETR